MRIKVLFGNWKMNKTVGEAIATADAILAGLDGPLKGEIGIAPPFISLAPLADRLRGSGLLLAGQNFHWEDQGAYTGEIAGPMLADIGCRHVIIGHSERRQFFNETNESVRLKVQAAFKSNLVPILCVGENREERESGLTLKKVEGQVRSALEGLTQDRAIKAVVAYEPIWAIGTGLTATPDQAQDVHAFIRGILADLFSAETAERIRIIYGGSVKPDNVDGLVVKPDIDGALVGGASLRAETFLPLIKAVEK